MKRTLVHPHQTIHTQHPVHHTQQHPRDHSQTIQYIHQCIFSPTVDALCKAIDNHQLIGFPPIPSTQIQKYLPESTATAKGHLRRVRKHTRSTTKMRQTDKQAINQDFRPNINAVVEFELFIGATIADQNDGTIYTDQTGAFPVTSYHSNKYQFVAYEYRSNAILVRALKDQTDKSLTSAFRDVYEYLTKRGFQPKLNVTDNQCNKAVEKYIRSTKADIQLVNPDDHRVNAAKRAIQTWKEHRHGNPGPHLSNPAVVSIYRTRTLNLLRVSRVNPKLSAYAILDGQFNFNKTPLAPVGTRALILLDPNTQKTWQNHALDAWYVGPAKNHCRNYRFFIPSTKGYRISGSAKFFPKHTKMPAIEPGDTIRLAAQDLITAIKNMSTAPLMLTPLHTTALRQLADIFATSTSVDQQPPLMNPTPVPRVHRALPPPRVSQQNTAPSTSMNPTDPATLRTQRHVHSRRTRNNTPIVEASNKINEQQNTTTPDSDPAPPRNYITQDEANTIQHNKHKLFTHSPVSPCNITHHALYHVVGTHLQSQYHNIFTPTTLHEHQPIFTADTQLEHVCNGVVHPITKETITKYEKLANDPTLQEVCMKAMCKELGRLAQGWEGKSGTDTIFFMTHEEIKQIPKDRTVTYARIVVNYRPQKDDPNRVRITVGRNLINYPDELTTCTADLTTAKILWNSMISTPGARFACADIENMYLQTPMDRYEYMRIKADLIPIAFMDTYKLWNKIYNGHVYMEIRRGCYGLPQAGILANKLLKQRLATDGYFELPHTPGLFKHISRPIQFTLVIDDFRIKYIGQQHLDHLLQTIKKHYDVTVDHTGSLYCGITLNWNYNYKYLDISMPRKQQIKHIQQIVGSFLYYSRATDPTISHALSELATQQSHATENTLKRCNRFLDYIATNPAARIRYYASDMVLNVHSDASYLSVKAAKSRVAGIFFLGSIPKHNQPIQLNGTITVLCTILKFVAASAAEAELGALFLNAKEAKIMRLTLQELGHPQPPAPIHCDNSTTIGIVNNTLLENHINKLFDFQYHPGLENLADYPSKAHPGGHHLTLHPLYVHMPPSPRFLARAAKPSVRRGCAYKVGHTGIHKYPLPTLTRVPRGTDHMPAAAA
eukprot:CCRYP_011030-RA/>CCRYP_011030-RA protein AED:0.16 eAED:0.16 QI:0/0/0/1/0.25/0/5/0/1115